MRQALALPIEQGEGRSAAVLYNNLSLRAWLYEGPQAAPRPVAGGDRVLPAARPQPRPAESMAGGQPTALGRPRPHGRRGTSRRPPLANRLEEAGDIQLSSLAPAAAPACRTRPTRPGARPGPMLEAARRQRPTADDRAARSPPPPRSFTPRAGPNRRAPARELEQIDASRADPVYASRPARPRPRRPRPQRPATLAAGLTAGVPTTHASRRSTPSPAATLNSPKQPEPGEAARLYADAAQRWHSSATYPTRLRPARPRPQPHHPRRPRRSADQPARGRELFASMGYKPALRRNTITAPRAPKSAASLKEDCVEANLP